MQYNIHTKKYEGPMELIFDLISKNKVDIRDISIVEITDQYLEYINNFKVFDLDLSSEFISMASKLLEIKSRYILYKKSNQQDYEDPRNELVQKIEEYKKFKELAEKISESIEDFGDIFYRDKCEESEDEDLNFSNITMEEIKKLLRKISEMLRIEKTVEIPESEEKLKKIIEGKNISVEDRIDKIRDIIKVNDRIEFNSIIENGDKKEVIANFLALLELIKLREILIKQETVHSRIIIEKIDSNYQHIPLIEEDDIYEIKAQKRLMEKGGENSEKI